MKDYLKSAAIFVLLIIIIVGVIFFRDYQKTVTRELNYSISSNLKETQNQLQNLRADLKRYDGKQMDLDEFQSILAKYDWDYFVWSNYTENYKSIDKRYEWADFSDLNLYISGLSYKNIPAGDIDYHKNNLLKICMYWNTLTFKIHDNYLEPKRQLTKVLKITGNAIKEGRDRLDEYESENQS